MSPALEPTITEAFKANPFFFLASTALAAVAGLFALVALALLFKKPKLSIVLGALAVIGSLAAFGFGALGWTLAVSRVDGAASTPSLSASDRARITSWGHAEASFCLKHGALVSVLPFLGGLVGLGVGVARRKAT
jgi:hypothetical protein